LILEEDQLSSGKDLPSKSQEHPSTENQENQIHPYRILQIGKGSESPETENSQTESDRVTSIVQSTGRFIEQSRKERKALRQKPFELPCTRSGKIPGKPLTKKQRNRLQAIPKDIISEYLRLRKK